MNYKRTARYASFFVAILALLAMPVNAAFMKAYPAQIGAKGTLALKAFSGEPASVTVDTNFTAVVPEAISPGAYENVDFIGFAAVSGEHEHERAKITFDGLLTIADFNFWVKFGEEKPSSPDIAEGRYSASGKLNITITQPTAPPPEITWVLMKGKIDKYGENPAFGGLMAHAKIGGDNNWTKVNGAFTLQEPEEASTLKNSSRSFYVVTLANATEAELNYDGKDLYIEGQWNVYNRTVTVTVIDNTDITTTITIHPKVLGAPGRLNVTLVSKPSQVSWKIQGNFTLQIQGIEVIAGGVTFYHVKLARPFERGIPFGDFNQDYAVNVLDVAQVGKAFGTKLGLPRYSFDLDLNSDFEINVIDLAAAAHEFGEEY